MTSKRMSKQVLAGLAGIDAVLAAAAWLNGLYGESAAWTVAAVAVVALVACLNIIDQQQDTIAALTAKEKPHG